MFHSSFLELRIKYLVWKPDAQKKILKYPEIFLVKKNINLLALVYNT